MDKTNFILYKDYQDHVELLTDEQAGKLFKAIFKYVDGRQEVELDGMTSMAFSFIKASLERDLVKYKKRVVASQENGKLGGRPKLTDGLNGKPKEPSGLSRHPRKGDSVSVSDTVNDKEVNRVPYADILKTWNETEELCEIRIYQDKRKKKIKKVYDIDNGKTFKEIVTKAINSNFMVEKKLTNIDWMMNEDNYAKILEGKYDNKE
jgi:hypothetical protein